MTLNHDAVLQGTLPADWANQSAVPQLKYLDLSYNYQVSGTIPDTWGDGEGLQSLTKLSVHSCNLTGTLPVSWVNGLPVLSALDLAYNYLTGTQSPFVDSESRITQEISNPAPKGKLAAPLRLLQQPSGTLLSTAICTACTLCAKPSAGSHSELWKVFRARSRLPQRWYALG